MLSGVVFWVGVGLVRRLGSHASGGAFGLVGWNKRAIGPIERRARASAKSGERGRSVGLVGRTTREWKIRMEIWAGNLGGFLLRICCFRSAGPRGSGDNVLVFFFWNFRLGNLIGNISKKFFWNLVWGI